MCITMHMNAYVRTRIPAHMCVHTWRPKVNVRYLSQSLPTLLFEIGSGTEPGGHLLSYAGWSLTP